jgi:hypothetical protein
VTARESAAGDNGRGHRRELVAGIKLVQNHQGKGKSTPKEKPLVENADGFSHLLQGMGLEGEGVRHGGRGEETVRWKRGPHSEGKGARGTI